MRASLGSRRAADGRFVQPWAGDEPARGLGDLLKWRLQRMRQDIPPNPPASAFRTQHPRIARPAVPAHGLRITWVGHATFLIQVHGLNILTDPVWSRRASPVSWAGPSRLVAPGISWDALPPIDAVLISHDHYDHLDRPTVDRLAERYVHVRWITPLGYAGWFRSRGIERITELDWWGRTTLDSDVGEVEVYATPAQHWTSRTLLSTRTRLWSSFVVRGGRTSVFFGGDSGYFEGFKAIGKEFGPLDAALLPIGAYAPRWFMKYAHMNPEEAVTAYLDLGGRGTFAGMHWGTFRLTDEDPLEPPRRAAEAWAVHGLPAESLWLPGPGETRVLFS